MRDPNKVSNHYRITKENSGKSFRIEATIEGKDPERKLSNQLDSVVKTAVAHEESVADVIMTLNEFEEIQAKEDKPDEKEFVLRGDE